MRCLQAPSNAVSLFWDIATLKPHLAEEMTRISQTVQVPQWHLEKGVQQAVGSGMVAHRARGTCTVWCSVAKLCPGLCDPGTPACHALCLGSGNPLMEGMMLKLKLQYFGHLMQRVDSLEKTLMLGGIGGRRRRGR